MPTCAALVALAWIAASASTQGGAAGSVEGDIVRFAHYPALSPDGRRLCFEYRGDLWICSAVGGHADRLTVHSAYDAFPRWSPDGRWIAYSSARYGNLDVFLIPSQGGEPRRLTFHPADDSLCAWSPDGEWLLFSAARDTQRDALYRVSVRTGHVQRVTAGASPDRFGAYSSDGRSVLFARGGAPWWQRRSVGPGNLDVYERSLVDGTERPMAHSSSGELWPMTGPEGAVYWVDCHRTPNVVQRSLLGPPRSVTTHQGEGVRHPDIARDGSAIAYECGDSLWMVDPGKPGSSRKLEIRITADAAGGNVVRRTFTEGVTALAPAPDGKSVAVVVHGHLWVIPVAGGEAKRLTFRAVVDGGLSWTPDSRAVCCVLAEAGRMRVVLVDASAGTETRLAGDDGEWTRPIVAPQGGLVGYVRTTGRDRGLYAQPMPGSRHQEPLLLRAGDGFSGWCWSPDGRWLAFAQRGSSGRDDVYIVSAAGGRAANVTRWPARYSSPVWSSDGRSLLFVGSRDGSSGDGAGSLWVLPLVGGKDGATTAPLAAPRGPRWGPGRPAGPAPVVVEFDGISERVREVPVGRIGGGPCAPAPDGRTVAVWIAGPAPPGWWLVDTASGAQMPLVPLPEAGRFASFSGDGSRLWLSGPGGQILTVLPDGGVPSQLSFRASVTVDEAADRLLAFDEAWRALTLRSGRGAKLGLDRDEVRERWEQRAMSAGAPEDFVYLLNCMVDELDVTCVEVALPVPDAAAGPGYLGLTFDDQTRGPGLRVSAVVSSGPCDRPGTRILPGEYVVSIDDETVACGENVHELLIGKAGRTVRLLVGARPQQDGARPLTVTCVSRPEYLDLVDREQAARAAVAAAHASDNRVSYVRCSALDRNGLNVLERALAGRDSQRPSLLIDMRGSKGGALADAFLRSILSDTPRRPMAVLIDEATAPDAVLLASRAQSAGIVRVAGPALSVCREGAKDVVLRNGVRLRIPAHEHGPTTPPGRLVPDVAPRASLAGDAQDPQILAAVRSLLAR